MYGLSAVAADRRQLGVALVLLAVRLDPRDALLGQQRGGAREEADRVEQVAGDHRHVDVQLEVARSCRRSRSPASFPITCARDLRHDLRNDGVHLARHDRAALLELRQEDLGRARRAGRSPSSARSFAIFVSETATVLSAPDASTSASRAACASNGSAGAADRRGRSRRTRSVAHPRGELGVGVEPGPDGGAAERDLADAAQRRLRRARWPCRTCAA